MHGSRKGFAGQGDIFMLLLSSSFFTHFDIGYVFFTHFLRTERKASSIANCSMCRILDNQLSGTSSTSESLRNPMGKLRVLQLSRCFLVPKFANF
jgi:hypothetical protein